MPDKAPLFSIRDYDDRYRPYDKGGRDLNNATWVKLPAKPKGDGLQELLAQRRGLEIFAVWCLLLEKATATKPEHRGKLLNHKDEPASCEEIAKGISLKNRVELVKTALAALVSIGWLECGGDVAFCHKMSPKSRVEYSSVEKSKESRRFTPPSLQEVSQFILENNHPISPKAFWNFYESKGWLVGKSKMKNWQAAVRQWAAREKKLSVGQQCSSSVKGYRCNKPAVFEGTDDTGQKYYRCAEHKK